MEYYNKESWPIGGDYDLSACVHYCTDLQLPDMQKVLAVIEGENDGNEWHWLIEMKNGKFIYLYGGCDYTGWDCQADANYKTADTVKELLLLVPERDNSYGSQAREIRAFLARQLLVGKYLSWEERKEKDLDIPMVDPQKVV